MRTKEIQEAIEQQLIMWENDFAGFEDEPISTIYDELERIHGEMDSLLKSLSIHLIGKGGN